tara:strand:- start:1486 stop:2445 length:960 start_codon:yes stop_codon:yes gene_type:complete
MKKKKTSHLEVIRSKNKNYIVTIAIGKKFFNDWTIFAKKNWVKYCKNNSLGLIVIKDHIIDKSNPFWKKPTWQKMLIGSYLKKHYKSKITNVCYLDSDILVNPFAPNVFKYHNKKKISLVSMINNLPFDLNKVRKIISFYRNKFYSKKYPLDSSIFMNLQQLYKFHKLKVQKDFACAGFFVFNIKYFAETMEQWFFKYKKNIKTLTGGGDQPIFNYEAFNTKKVKLLNYKFQALWIYEMSNKYNFLYKFKKNKNKVIKDCIEASLLENYFLHFAGSWYEGHMWKIKNILDDKSYKNNLKLNKYLRIKSSGKSIGRILPK